MNYLSLLSVLMASFPVNIYIYVSVNKGEFMYDAIFVVNTLAPSYRSDNYATAIFAAFIIPFERRKYVCTRIPMLCLAGKRRLTRVASIYAMTIIGVERLL